MQSGRSWERPDLSQIWKQVAWRSQNGEKGQNSTEIFKEYWWIQRVSYLKGELWAHSMKVGNKTAHAFAMLA